jgi:hypothetical protein
MSDLAELTDFFGPPISVYTRADALADGVLVSAMEGDLLEVTCQHFKFPVAMTAAVASIIDRAVTNPRHANDRRGVWHDICWMLSRKIAGLPRRSSVTELSFTVIITGAGPGKYWTFKALMGGDDDGGACLTILLPDED